MVTCYGLLFHLVEGITTPLFNIVVSLFPFAFLFFLLLRAEEQNKKSQPLSTLSSKLKLFKKDNLMSESSRFIAAPANEENNSNSLLQFFRFDGNILVQYYSIIRLLTLLDFIAMVVLLLATGFITDWFRVAAIFIRLLYRATEFTTLIVLVLPMSQLKSDPRQILFDWRPVLLFVLPVSGVFLVTSMNGWLSCPNFYVPQYDLTFATPKDNDTQKIVYNLYVMPDKPSCDFARNDWLACDLLDALIFLIFFFLPFIPKKLIKGHFLGESVTEFQIFNFTIYPRKSLIGVSSFLFLTRFFRIIGDFLAIYSTNDYGGPFLCFFGLGYLLEQALFAPVLFWTLRYDSAIIYKDTQTNNQGENITRTFVRYADDTKWNHEIPVNQIELNHIIGRGQFLVFRGLWMGTPCAVKRIPYPTQAQIEINQKDILEFVQKELVILSSVGHPNVVQFLGFCPCVKVLPRTSTLQNERGSLPFETAVSSISNRSIVNHEMGEKSSSRASVSIQHELWIVMEYLPRRSLYDLLADTSVPITIPDIIRMSQEICRGMSYLIKKNIIHCDLKSLNIFVGSGFNLKIGDFGESHLLQGMNVESMSYNPNVVVGSFHWMAPEVIERKLFTEKSDVYSFGIVLWEMVTRQKPYEDNNDVFNSQSGQISEIFKARVISGLRPEIPPDCHESIKSILLQCWNPDPALRPTFSQILELLNNIS